MSAQKVKKSSPVKQGPMKATIPMSSLLRHSSNLRKSPALSPTGSWRHRVSPESGQRSPGALSYKAKSRTLGEPSSVSNSGNFMRRTASLDAIYLKGQWPRENFYFHNGLLQIDKATQTDDFNLDSRSKSRMGDPYQMDDKIEKLFRHRMQRKDATGRERTPAFGLLLQTSPGTDNGMPNASSQTSASTLLSPTSKATPMNIPVKPLARPPMRNSIEGLNQEIERLVLRATANLGAPFTDKGEEDKYQATPEGHRAPLADLLRSTRSVNTQTPGTSDFAGSCHSSDPPSRESSSPLIPGHFEASRPSSRQDGSHTSSPSRSLSPSPSPSRLLGTSPHINKFLAREPPDGCERVHLRFCPTELDLGPRLDWAPGSGKPCVAFQLKPSLGSAFYPLRPAAREGGEGGVRDPADQDFV